jgi:integrase
MIKPGALARLNFREAARMWIESHRIHIAPGTIRHYHCTTKALLPFFSELKLKEIHIGHFEQYQKMRTEGTGGLRAAGPRRVNHELNTLSQILARAGLWGSLRDLYRPLRLPKLGVGFALGEDEQEYLFAVSSSRPRWRVAYLASLVTVNTTAGPGEILGLTLADVKFGPDPEIHIRQVKNRYRDRWLPLNPTAADAIRELVEIAHSKGAERPTDYLLPHRAKNGSANWDPSRPMYSWRKSWNAMRAEAAKKFPKLARLRMYDLRHTVITRLLENSENSEETVVSLAGWVSANMKKTYSHVRDRPRREAVAALDKKTSPVVGLPGSSFQWFASTITGALCPPPFVEPPATTTKPATTIDDTKKLRLVKGQGKSGVA